MEQNTDSNSNTLMDQGGIPQAGQQNIPQQLPASNEAILSPDPETPMAPPMNQPMATPMAVLMAVLMARAGTELGPEQLAATAAAVVVTRCGHTPEWLNGLKGVVCMVIASISYHSSTSSPLPLHSSIQSN